VILKAVKPKTCEYCGKPFTPFQSMQRVCPTVRCARGWAAMKSAQGKRELRARKEAIKTRTDWLAECQAIVNKIARLRDAKDGCISCEKPPTWDGQWHGSHYRSVGAASAVRLCLWNIHKACSQCNHHKSGNIADYRPRLIEKIGLEKVEWLDSQNQVVRYEVDYLKRFKSVMGKKLKRMEKRVELESKE
jgi:hypothetical protein